MNYWGFLLTLIAILAIATPYIDRDYEIYECHEDLPYEGLKSYKFYKNGGWISAFRSAENLEPSYLSQKCEIVEGERYITYVCDNRMYKMDKWDLSVDLMYPNYCKTPAFESKWVKNNRFEARAIAIAESQRLKREQRK